MTSIHKKQWSRRNENICISPYTLCLLQRLPDEHSIHLDTQKYQISNGHQHTTPTHSILIAQSQAEVPEPSQSVPLFSEGEKHWRGQEAPTDFWTSPSNEESAVTNSAFTQLLTHHRPRESFTLSVQPRVLDRLGGGGWNSSGFYCCECLLEFSRPVLMTRPVRERLSLGHEQQYEATRVPYAPVEVGEIRLAMLIIRTFPFCNWDNMESS